MKFFRKLLPVMIAALLLSVFAPLAASAADVSKFTSDFEKKNATTGFAQNWTLGQNSAWKLFSSDAEDSVVGKGNTAAVFDKGGSSVSKIFTSVVDLSDCTSAKVSFMVLADKAVVSASNDLTVVLYHGETSIKLWSLNEKKGSLKTALTTFEVAITKNLVADAQIGFEATGSELTVYLDDVKVTGTQKSSSNTSSGSSTVSAVTVIMPDPEHNLSQENLKATANNASVDLSWKGDTVGGKFQAGKEYKATVSVNATDGYTFAENATIAVKVAANGNPSSGIISDITRAADKITFVLTFNVAHSATKITGASATGITRKSVTLALSYSGSYEVSEKGFYWGTDQANLSSTDYVDDSNTVTLSGLSGGKTYFYRAFVVTPEGEILSSVKSFITLTGLSVNVTKSAGGSVSPEGVYEVEGGASLTITVTPDTGYTVNYVTVDNQDVTLENNTYTFTNITNDHTFFVAFKPIATDTSSEPVDDPSSGGGFLKVLIVILAVFLAAAVLFLFAKPAGMPVGVALSNLSKNISRSIKRKFGGR